MKKNVILLTGCAGFIGSHTCRQLLEAGHTVVGVDNFDPYYPVKLKHDRIEKLKSHPCFEFFQGDIENKSFLKGLFEKYQITSVVNLAARAGVRNSILYPDLYMKTNVLGTLNILELMREFQVKKLVLASTSSLYAGQPTPFSEACAVNEPLSPYAASKKAAEMLAYTYYHLYGISITILRYFTVYGPSGRPDMAIYRFIQWIDQEKPIELLGDGHQSRDFTYVDDIARGTCQAITLPGFEVINLGGGRNPVTMLQIINIIEQLLHKKATINFQPAHKADMNVTWADTQKAQKLLEWNARVSVQDGLQKTVDWYLANKSWINELKN